MSNKRGRPSSTAQDPIFATCEAIADLMATPRPPDEDRRCYLIVLDERPGPKIPFENGLLHITGLHDPKRALARFRKFLLEDQKFSAQEVSYFIESRTDRMPPTKRGRLPFEPAWWDYGGFLQSELPTFNALFHKWSAVKRSKNFHKKEGKPFDEVKFPKRPPKVPRNAPTGVPKTSRKM